jgi:hypothetical protein
MKTLVTALPLLFLLASCDDTPGKWSLYVYPDARDRTKWERTDRFKTERMCVRAGREAIDKLPHTGKASFECEVLKPI